MLGDDFLRADPIEPTSVCGSLVAHFQKVICSGLRRCRGGQMGIGYTGGAFEEVEVVGKRSVTDGVSSSCTVFRSKEWDDG